MSDIPTIEEFAADPEQQTVRCSTCKSPWRPDIERARAKGISYEKIASWLRKFHPEHEQNALALRNHFVSGHAEHS